VKALSAGGEVALEAGRAAAAPPTAPRLVLRKLWRFKWGVAAALVLAVIAVLGPSLVNMILVIGAADWPLYARVIRAETLALREREFVVASRALGMSHARIVFRQILPNLVSVIVVIATLQIARVIILESFLSFLGLGVQPPTPAWGNMLGEGRVYMLNSWWIAAFPGLAIFVTTLAINLMGNALRDWLDPHMKV
jgi:ABC-type dipeptide/oligopeptide/nickel transport system permease subunit